MKVTSGLPAILAVAQVVASNATILTNLRSLVGGAPAEGSRELEDLQKSTIRCFTECIEQQMSAAQCEEHIKSVLGEDLSGHVVPNLEIKIHNPRPMPTNPIAKERTYYEIGIPTNLRGEVACDINGGDISVPWKWPVSETEKVDIPTVNCMGLDATECCDKFFNEIDAAGIPRVNHYGHCLSCWVDQELLEPIILESNGEIGYRDYTASSGTCLTHEIDHAGVREQDTMTRSELDALASDITSFLDNGASCTDLSTFQVAARFHARGLPDAMRSIANLLCGFCESPNMTYAELPPKLSQHLTRIYEVITSQSPKSDENFIVIYTNEEGQVIEPPKVGGNRANIDSDLDDPDCDEMEGPGPVDGPGDGSAPGSGTGTGSPSGNNSASGGSEKNEKSVKSEKGSVKSIKGSDKKASAKTPGSTGEPTKSLKSEKGSVKSVKGSDKKSSEKAPGSTGEPTKSVKSEKGSVKSVKGSDKKSSEKAPGSTGEPTKSAKSEKGSVKSAKNSDKKGSDKKASEKAPGSTGEPTKSVKSEKGSVKSIKGSDKKASAKTLGNPGGSKKSIKNGSKNASVKSDKGSEKNASEKKRDGSGESMAEPEMLSDANSVGFDGSAINDERPPYLGGNNAQYNAHPMSTSFGGSEGRMDDSKTPDSTGENESGPNLKSGGDPIVESKNSIEGSNKKEGKGAPHKSSNTDQTGFGGNAKNGKGAKKRGNNGRKHNQNQNGPSFFGFSGTAHEGLTHFGSP